MKATGIVRRIDDLGRIVIPKEIRRTLHIRETDPMEIFTDAEGQIILKKYSPIGDISTFAGKYAESLSDATGMTVCITDREQVIAASGDDKKNLMNKPVTKELNQAMEGRCTIAAGEGEDGFVKVTDEAQFKQEIMYPIICQGDVLGTVLMMSIDMKPKFTDNEKKMVKTAANFLGKHMESLKEKIKEKNMRLDKYLKVSRLIKRRTVANDACDAGRVMVNDKVVKASYDVKVGDIIEIQFGNKNVRARVTDVKDTVKKEEAKEMFEYL